MLKYIKIITISGDGDYSSNLKHIFGLFVRMFMILVKFLYYIYILESNLKKRESVEQAKQ